MKKVLSVVLAIILASTMVACGMEETTGKNESPVTAETQKVVESKVKDSVTESKEEPAKTADVPDWKAFLKEYEDWVDEYIKITKKYSENPADLSILSDYTEMLTEMTDWAEKTEEMEKSLEEASTDELLEYTNELVRIAAKIAEAAY